MRTLVFAACLLMSGGAMADTVKLHAAGSLKAALTQVRMFARNRLCAIAQAGVTVSTDTLLDVLLDPKITVGTSTPKADPSGDYAWRLFAKADKVKPGAEKTLDAKAVKLTGGPTSEKAPKGRNQYGWVMENKRADVCKSSPCRMPCPSVRTMASP